MKRSIFAILILLLATVSVYSQDSLFIRTYGLIGYNYGEKVIQTPDSGFIILGNKSGFIGNTDAYLIKTNKYGDYSWDKAYGNAEIDWAEDFVRTYDHGYVIAGYMTVPESNNDYDIMLLKTDSIGNLLWTYHYGGTSWDFAHSIIETPDSGFIITGETYSFGNGNNDVFFLKTNKEGDSLWMKTYGGINSEIGYDINLCHDDNYIITGITNSFGHGMYDAYLIKINPEGDTIWSKTYGDTLDDKAFAGIETSDHGFAITGSTRNYGVQGQDAYILKTDASGNENWIRTYGGSNEEEDYDIIEMPNNNLFIVGYTKSFGNIGSKEFYMIITDPGGWFVTGPTFGGEEDETARACINTMTGGLAIVGSTESLGLGLSNILLLKSDSMGATNIGSHVHITDLEEYVSNNSYTIYPNPSSGLITIVNDPNVIPDKIEIFDQMGQKVYSVENVYEYEMTFDLSDLCSGTYLMVVNHGFNNIIRRFILLNNY